MVSLGASDAMQMAHYKLTIIIINKDAIHADTVDNFKINLSEYGYQTLKVKSCYYTDRGILNHYKYLLCYLTKKKIAKTKYSSV